MEKIRALRPGRLAAVICIVGGLLCGRALAAEALVPAGEVIGIRMDIDGVLVAGFSEVQTAEGIRSPAEEAGVREGDVIVAVNGYAVHSAEELSCRMEALDGESAELTLRRSDRVQTVCVVPAEERDGELRLGLLLREGLAGLGTVTYIDPATGNFGALGHGVNDGATGVLLPLEEGSICRGRVIDVMMGEPGEPGELVGSFDTGDVIGSVERNTAAGIFGCLNVTSGGEAVPVCPPQEIRNGPATIRSCVGGETVAEYDVQISRTGVVAGDGRDLMVRVTDPELLTLTGGIVQGMSGSPIIQDGKLVGAVTHVLVNDPTRGYGIFIENMLEAAG